MLVAIMSENIAAQDACCLKTTLVAITLVIFVTIISYMKIKINFLLNWSNHSRNCSQGERGCS